ncbi:MAG: hypothetical protein WC906_02050 [Parcubacteria group bacterium]
MSDKATKKEQNFCNLLFLDMDVFLKALENFFAKEIKKIKNKEKEYESILKFINNFKVRDSFSEELKVFSVVVFIIVSAIWLGDRSAIPIARSDDSGITNAQTKETIETKETAKEVVDVEKNESNEKKADMKAANEYKLKTPGELCEEDKDQKRSSDLCGKDDEEKVKEIAQAKEREDRSRLVNLKPKVVKLSCPESNYGHPSKSDTKGKHMDEDCCPDPDEWPKPGCVYDAKGYSIMLKGPK